MSNTISIIMPVKNAENYLEACINSILQQSYGDWELIAVNDNSSDSTSHILASFADQDPRIKVLPNKGSGIIPALQTGYAKATGTYITRMDADDLMAPQKLKSFLTAWQEVGRGYIVTGLVEYFAEMTLGDGYKKYADWLNSLTLTGDNFKDSYKECSIASPNWFIHRADFDLAGAFSADIYPEDYCLLFRWKKQNFKVKGVPEVTHRWRDYTVRTSRTDDNYSDNRFTAIKVKYFLEIDYKPARQLVLWGAGPKGKAIAKALIQNHIRFSWVCNNPKKIGKDIYDVRLNNIDLLTELNNPQLIIAVSQRDAQAGIRQQVEKHVGAEAFYFC